MIDTGVEVTTNVGATKRTAVHMPTLTGSLPSRLGFRGSEDLGGGLSASFWIESGINPDSGTGGTTTPLLAIAERLVKSDSGNAFWQHHLSVSYERVGGAQAAHSRRLGLRAAGDGRHMEARFLIGGQMAFGHDHARADGPDLQPTRADSGVWGEAFGIAHVISSCNF